ncbi:MAG TPA: hypothetical protein VGO79_13335 [Thermoanaerobaculia bacterium]|jgi:hypothetical protein
MEPVVGIFVSRQDAADASLRLRSRGFAPERVQLLLPSTPHAEDVMPTEDAEQSGTGQAVGGVVGGTIGATAGMGLGAAVASVLVPGVGAVTAIGLAAAALLGVGGAVGGAALGGELEERTREGVPRDEAYLYEDALRHGRSIVLAIPETEEEERASEEILKAAGAESLDAARETWWVGLRDAERAHYEGAGGNFEDAEKAYRHGFVSALHPENRGRVHAIAAERLRERHGDLADSEDFRRGYARGLDHAAAFSAPPGAAAAEGPAASAKPKRRGGRKRLPGEASR